MSTLLVTQVWEDNKDILAPIFQGPYAPVSVQSVIGAEYFEGQKEITFFELVNYCVLNGNLHAVATLPAIASTGKSLKWRPIYAPEGKPTVAKGPPFTTIVADPPWKYGNTKAKGAAEKHYPTMAVDEIKAMPVFGLATGNAHLYLWTTNYFLASGEAGMVCRAWGFEPKTIITWEKTGRLGVGNYFRNSTEHMVFAVRGSLPTAPPNSDRTCFHSPWLAHSRKPAWAYELIEKKSPGPFLELFARAEPNGQQKLEAWTRWGNEATGGEPVAALDAYFKKFKEHVAPSNA